MRWNKRTQLSVAAGNPVHGLQCYLRRPLDDHARAAIKLEAQDTAADPEQLVGERGAALWCRSSRLPHHVHGARQDRDLVPAREAVILHRTLDRRWSAPDLDRGV